MAKWQAKIASFPTDDKYIIFSRPKHVFYINVENYNGLASQQILQTKQNFSNIFHKNVEYLFCKYRRVIID